MGNSLKTWQRLERILDATTEGWWEWNVETNYTYHSPGWYRMLGISEKQYASSFQLWEELMHPDDRARAIYFQQILVQYDEPWEQEFRMRHANGEYIWVLSRGSVLYRSADGKPLLVGGLHINITPQKKLHRLNEDIKTQEELIQGILKISWSSITLYDFLLRRMSFTSGHIMKKLGYTEDEFMQVSEAFYQGIVHPDDQPVAQQHIRKLIESTSGQTLDCTVRLRDKEGKYHHILLRDSVFSRDAGGHPQEILCSAIDISRYLELKSKIEENVKFIRELSFRNSHEMRAPVATILGLVGLLKHEIHSPASVVELVGYLEQTVVKLDDMVREMTSILNDKINLKGAGG